MGVLGFGVRVLQGLEPKTKRETCKWLWVSRGSRRAWDFDGFGVKISDHVSELLLAVLGWCLCVFPIMTQHRNLSCGLEADRLQTVSR